MQDLVGVKPERWGLFHWVFLKDNSFGPSFKDKF